MKAVIQRVNRSSVTIDGEVHASIAQGLMVLLGIEDADTAEDIEWLSGKIVNLRIFDDAEGVMNESVKDKKGDILLISQFTLHGDIRKGRRPSFDQPAEPDLANQLYEQTIALVRQQGIAVETGTFAAHMHVTSANDGPVTFLLDSATLV